MNVSQKDLLVSIKEIGELYYKGMVHTKDSKFSSRKSKKLMKNSVKEFKIAVAYLNYVRKPRKTINEEITTSLLAQEAAYWSGMKVSNGAMIAAAVFLRFCITQVGKKHHDAFINISKTVKPILFSHDLLK